MNSLLKIVSEDTHEHSHAACSAGVSLNITAAGENLDARQFKGRAAVVTLGCAKNQVDSEVMIGVLRKSGYEIVSELERADVAVVNTCGFLQSAVKESVDSILEVADYKKKGRLRTLIVAGCLVERYREDLRKTLPEVDKFILVDDILKVAEAAEPAGASPAIGSVLDNAARPYFLYDETMPRQISSAGYTAYVKVSEGCDRPCTFCIIPKIRGAMRSRSVESIRREVEALAQRGVREINLVAQDLTSYGLDRRSESGQKEDLVALLRALDSVKPSPWIRLLYAYPVGITEELLDAIVELPSVCKYLDLPLQHASEDVLKVMKRPLGRYSPRKIMEFIKTRQPSIQVRSTFIVGFPGETEADVDQLEAFIREGNFSNVGVFTYSAEEGTPAHEMAGQISEAKKNKRRERLMLAQQEVITERNQKLIGQEYEVLVEGTHSDTDLLLSARTRFQAPEVDSSVIINDFEPGVEVPQTGDLGLVRITETAGYDLVGTYRTIKAASSAKTTEQSAIQK